MPVIGLRRQVLETRQPLMHQRGRSRRRPSRQARRRSSSARSRSRPVGAARRPATIAIGVDLDPEPRPRGRVLGPRPPTDHDARVEPRASRPRERPAVRARRIGARTRWRRSPRSVARSPRCWTCRAVIERIVGHARRLFAARSSAVFLAPAGRRRHSGDHRPGDALPRRCLADDSIAPGEGIIGGVDRRRSEAEVVNDVTHDAADRDRSRAPSPTPRSG